MKMTVLLCCLHSFSGDLLVILHKLLLFVSPFGLLLVDYSVLILTLQFSHTNILVVKLNALLN